MKLKILLAALFVAGIVTALAVAAPPPGKGNPHKQGPVSTTSSTSTSTSTTTAAGRRVALCHKTGNGTFHAITVAKSAVAAHLRHGDYAGSDCTRSTTTGTTSTATSTAATTTT